MQVFLQTSKTSENLTVACLAWGICESFVESVIADSGLEVLIG